jgi:LysR family transcriptional activator of glutamate synthase operon
MSPKPEEFDMPFDEHEVGFHELEIFLEFSRTEHLGQTAEALGYSVSSIQRAVRVLEKRFGVPLVQREGRRVRLLHTGHVLADHAAQVLRARSEAINAVLVAAGRRQIKLRLGHNFSLGLDVVPSVVAALLAREPETQILLRSGTTTAIISSLLSGTLDAALVSPPPAEPELEVVPLYSEASKLIVSVRDPLAGGTNVDLATVRDRAFVALEDGTWSRQELLKACARAGFVPKVTVEVSDMITLQGIVSEGVAIAIIAERIATHGHPDIVALTIDGVAAHHRTVGLAYPREHRDSRLITSLRTAAKGFIAHPR